MFDNGSAIVGDVRLDSAGANYDLTEPEVEIIAKITASLPSELSEVQQANTKALLVHHRKILSPGDHAIVRCRINMDDVRQTSQLLRRQAFELAKLSTRHTDEMLAHSMITLATSTWASHVVFVAHTPLKFRVDFRRLNGISSQEKYDAHANSVKVAALSHGTESQLVVRYDREGVATLLSKRLPSVADMGVGDAAPYCDDLPVQLDSPTVHTVKAVIQGEEDIFGLAGGSLEEEWIIDKKSGALVVMRVSPNSNTVQNEAELTKKLSWDGLIAQTVLYVARK